ncbi:TPA: hypothetical protein NR579_000290 [Staphylococcus aureus]|nr:hypothetical protein [Staphylococcus aureus]
MSNKLDEINKIITAKHKQMDDLYDEKRVVKALIDESDALNHSIDQLYQHLGERYYSSNMASRMEQFRDEFHFAKRRSTEALYEQQQQIQHGIRKAEEEMIDLEMQRNVEIETVTCNGNRI